MKVLQAYLQTPKVKKALSTKPGQEGFSLIELVVVVAVLAILAAIAIPAFTSINDKAAVSAAQNTLAQIVKECAVKAANNEDEEFNIPNLNSYELDNGSIDDDMGDCEGDDGVIALDENADNDMIPEVIAINVNTGAKTCTAGDDDEDNAFCSEDGTW